MSMNFINLKIPKFENLKMNSKLKWYNKTTECFSASSAMLLYLMNVFLNLKILWFENLKMSQTTFNERL